MVHTFFGLCYSRQSLNISEQFLYTYTDCELLPPLELLFSQNPSMLNDPRSVKWLTPPLRACASCEEEQPGTKQLQFWYRPNTIGGCEQLVSNSRATRQALITNSECCFWRCLLLPRPPPRPLQLGTDLGFNGGSISSCV